jgi:HK97 family phage portal protein
MNWRTRIAHWLVRSTYGSPAAWFLDLFGASTSSSGLKVGPETAQQSSAVFACVQVRSQDIAKLPIILYQRMADGSRRRATEHPLYNLIAARPNSRQTSFEWREMMQAALDLRGNAYSRITRDNRNRPIELIPLQNDWVTPMMAPDGTPFYEVRMYGRGEKERLSATDILHLRDRSDDGFVGKSCIARARDVVGLDLAASTHAAKLYANGAAPGGVITGVGKVGKDGRTLIKKEWDDDLRGVEKNGSVAVLAEGMKYEPVGMTNVDAEFVNNRKLSRSEIAAIFRVPAHKIGIMDNATFSNIEHQSLEYVTDTLMPVACRWEGVLNVTLLRESEQAEYYFEFLFDALLRGDFLSRMQGFAICRQWGLRSYNDIAKTENWNQISKDEGGDERLVPLNMWPMGQPRPEKVVQPNTPPGKAYEDYGADNVRRLPDRSAEHA